MILRRFSKIMRHATLAAMATGALAAASPALADDEHDPVQVTAQFDLRLVQSDLDFDAGEDFDSSGIGGRARVGLEYGPSKTTEIRVDAQVGFFDFYDEDRDDRTVYGAGIEVNQKVTEEIEVRVHARRIENIGTVEALSADQTNVGARLQWQKGNDRMRVSVEYLAREYDLRTPVNGDGVRVAAEYNRRLGSYHWLRFNARFEDIESEASPRRSHERFVARIKYSVPIAKRLRFRPSIEYRAWKYDDRIARGDPDLDLREDNYVAPRLELAYGRSDRGIFGEANVEYRLRSSNDIRFGLDAIRVGARIGYRF